MKKRTLLAVVLSGALTVGAVAQGMGNQPNMQGKGMMNSQQCKIKSQKIGMKGSVMGGGMQMFSQLDLTSDQKFQLSIIRDEMKIEIKKFMHQGQKMGQMGDFIKEDSFDKIAFKKYMKDKHEKILDLKANSIEKAFKILTKEQVTQLKQKLATK